MSRAIKGHIKSKPRRAHQNPSEYIGSYQRRQRPPDITEHMMMNQELQGTYRRHIQGTCRGTYREHIQGTYETTEPPMPPR
jgi:hypothetical protein